MSITTKNLNHNEEESKSSDPVLFIKRCFDRAFKTSESPDENLESQFLKVCLEKAIKNIESAVENETPEYLKMDIICVGLLDLDTNKTVPFNIGDSLDDSPVKRITHEDEKGCYLFHLTSGRIFVMPSDLIKWHIRGYLS